MSRLRERFLAHTAFILDFPLAVDADGMRVAPAPGSSSSLLESTRWIDDALEKCRTDNLLQNFLWSDGEFALIRLIEEYANSTDQTDVDFVHAACTVLSLVCSDCSDEDVDRMIVYGHCMTVFLQLLDHADTGVCTLAVECLEAVSRKSRKHASKILQCERAIDRIVQLLDESVTPAAVVSLAHLVTNLSFTDDAAALEVLLRLMPRMTDLLNEKAVMVPRNDSDEYILIAALKYFQHVSMNPQSPNFQRLLTSQVPEHVAFLLQQPAVLSRLPLVQPALYILNSIITDDDQHTSRFLELGRLGIVRTVLQDPLRCGEGLRDAIRTLGKIMVGESLESKQQLLDCDGLIQLACNAMLFLLQRHQAPDEQFICTGRAFSWMLKTLTENQDEDQLWQTVQEHHLLHALAMALTIPDDRIRNMVFGALIGVERRLGGQICEEYARDLLQNGTLHAIVNQFQFNQPHPAASTNAVFSAMIKHASSRSSAKVVDLLVLLGVGEQPVGSGEVNARLFLEVYARFRMPKVMVMLCAACTVARHRQTASLVNLLPIELWRMLTACCARAGGRSRLGEMTGRRWWTVKRRMTTRKRKSNSDNLLGKHRSAALVHNCILLRQQRTGALSHHQRWCESTLPRAI